MRLARGRERLLDPDVQLLRAGAEPAAAARPDRLGLRQLLHPEQAAVERARLSSQPGGAATWTWSIPRTLTGEALPSASVAAQLEDTLVGGYRRLAAETPRRRIDIELRVLDLLFATFFGLLLLPVALVIAVAIARHERPAGPLPRRARRPRRALLHDAQVPDARARRRDAARPVPRRGARPPDRGRVHADRPLAEGLAARRDPAALERAARRHVVRRAAADPRALLRRARDRAARLLAAARRAARSDRLRAGAPRLRDLDGREALPRPRVDRRPLGAALPADALVDRAPRARPGLHGVARGDPTAL